MDYTKEALHEEKNKINSIADLIEAIEELEWSVSDCDFVDGVGWELAKYSPAGEDFSFAIQHDNNINTAIQEIITYANNFDIDEHIELWINARQRNVGGIPPTRELVADAYAIQEMLNNLANYCKTIEFTKNQPLIEDNYDKWCDELDK